MSVAMRALWSLTMMCLGAGACSTSLESEAPSASEEQEATAARAASDPCSLLARRVGVTLEPTGGVSLASLLCEVIDLDRFTRPPAFPYRAKMASSYNRASVSPGAPGWFANDDYDHYLRSDGDEHVLMESFGPGAITRIWSANPSGTLRIYIDDPKTPALELPLTALFEGALGAPFSAPFVFDAAGGKNAYVPIPYAAYARVAVVSSERLFYHVNYREYPEETEVEPFDRARLEVLAPLVRELGRRLTSPASSELSALPSRTLQLSAQAPEQGVALGPSVVRELVVRGFDPSPEALRATRLILTVDGERTVDAPLGDLFGSGPGLGAHASLTTRVTPEALTLRWPMPVGRELRARVESRTGTPPALTLVLRYTQGLPAAPRLFHAAWTGPRTLGTGQPRDNTLLHYRGAGWYVGTVLNVANPSVAWWGEGDEKVFVDGESFPSHFGTGTEDYFGYAWCAIERFTRPLLGQTRADGPLNYGRYSMYRWHTADAVPFDSELRFDLEVLHWQTGLLGTQLHQDAVAFWYAAPGGASERPSPALADFRIPGQILPFLLPTPGYTCR